MRNIRDLAGGALLIALGLFMTVYSSTLLEMGTLNRIGPGMYPFGLGTLLISFGAIIFIPALSQPGVADGIDWRAVVTIFGAIAAFAATARPFGLIPAVMLLLAISRFANDSTGPRAIAVMMVSVPFAAWLLFIVGLGVPLPLVAWPF